MIVNHVQLKDDSVTHDDKKLFAISILSLPKFLIDLAY